MKSAMAEELPVETIELYVVRGKNGKWFGRSGRTPWVKELIEAKIYTKLGQARTRVTLMAKRGCGISSIVVLGLSTMKVVQEADRVEKQIQKQKERVEKQVALAAKQRLDWAQRDLEAAQERLRLLQQGR